MNNSIRRHPKGSIAIATLIVVAIIAVLYMMLIKAVLPGANLGGPAVMQDRPWLLDDLISPADRLIDAPNDSQVALNDGFELKAAVSRNGSDRDFAILKFHGSGLVSGNWKCDYTHEERQYSFSAEYKGNIVPDREFSDEAGTDDTRLFFITKGTYTQRIYHVDVGEKVTKGIIYLTGWVATDKSLTGILTITTDDLTDRDKWAASYDLTVPADQ
jgi:hypothetical protein